VVSAFEKAATKDFAECWMAQMPSDGDLLTVLAVAMREVDGIEVGSAVLPIQNQHPVLMAQRALMLNKIAGGRFILGLGMTHQVVTEGMWGIPYDKPVRRMREYLDALQPLLAGEAVDAVGETVTARGRSRSPPRRRRTSISPRWGRRCSSWRDGVRRAR
jgi:alkanesulfonate monooxygenase SsuD/methylene tetrahydromethanopterin reductase-like flavin-dependent oxidoreductase (luciferase family)